MASYDFSAPFVAARIVLPNGDAFPLWTNVGGEESVRPSIPGQPGLQALCFVQEVQVRLNLSGLPQISVQLSPPFEDGMKFLDSPLADGRMRNTLEVQLGYAGGTGDTGPLLSPPFVTALTAPEVTIDVEVQISLKGTGLGDSARLQGGRVVGRDGDTRRDIIQRLVAGEGGGRRTLEVDFAEADQDSSVRGLLDGSAANYCQGNRSDWLALWWLAQETHCIMNVVGVTENGRASRLLWIPRQRAFTGAPTRRYRLFHFPGGRFQGETAPTQPSETTTAELPILSFTCNTEAVWNALTYQDIAAHGARMVDTDPDTVQPTDATVTVATTSPPVDSGEGAQTVPGNEELPANPLPLPGDPGDEGARRQVEAEVENSGTMNVQCEIETIGDPAVTPGDVVLLAGLGRRFDQRVYHVFEVVHSIGVGGFSTNITVHSNVQPGQEGDEPSGERNTVDQQGDVGGLIAEDEGLSDRDLADLTGIQLD